MRATVIALAFLFHSCTIVCALPKEAVTMAGSLQWRHPHRVSVIRVSPDNKYILSACWDGVIRLWDLETGKELRQFKGHSGEILSLDLSPDGKQILSGGSDGTVRLRDLKTGKGTILRKGDAWVRAVLFSPDGQYLAAGDDEGKLQLWKSNALAQSASFVSARAVRTIAFSPDGRLVATNGVNDSIVIHDIKTRQAVKQFGEDRVRQLCYSPDGKLLAACDYDHVITIWNPSTGKKIEKLEGNPTGTADRHAITSVAFSPDGQFLASGGASQEVTLWRVKDWKELRQLKGHRGTGQALAFSPNGKWLIAGGLDQRLTCWNVSTGKPIKEAPGHDGKVTGVALSPSGSLLATVCEDGKLRLWDAKTGKLRREIPVADARVGCACFRNEEEIITGDETGHLRCWSTGSGKKNREWKGHLRDVTSLALSEEGKRLASCSMDRRIGIWDIETGRELKKIARPAESGFASVSFLRQGAQVTAISLVPRFCLWDLKKEEVVQQFAAPRGGGLALVVTPDSRTVISAGRDAIIHFHEVASGLERRKLAGTEGWTRALALSPDGRVLASGHDDGSIILWAVGSGKKLLQFIAHRGPVTSLAFSKKGERLASGSADSVAMIWSVTAAVESIRQQKPIRLSKQELSELWEALAGRNGTESLRAMQKLALAAQDTTTFLETKLSPITDKMIDEAIKNLDSRTFSIRNEATMLLQSMGQVIRTKVEAELQRKPTLEKRRRLQRLLDEIQREGRSVGELQVLRGIEVLEMIGTDQAKKQLKKLASGTRESSITQQAKEAVERLEK